MLRVFLKDSVTYALSAIVSRGLSFFLIPLYTRILSPRDYGSFDLLTVFASIVNLTIALEISQGLARFYTAESDYNLKTSYASSALLFTFFCYSIFLVFTLLFTQHLSVFIMGQFGLDVEFQIGMIYIWISGIFYLIQSQFRWALRSKDYAIVSVLTSIISAVSSVFFAYILNLELKGLLLGLISGSLCGACFGLWRLRNLFRLRFELACLRAMLLFSTPLVFSSAAVWISLYADRVMIKYFLSVEAVGVYGIAYRVASVAGLVMVGFQSSLSPLIYTYHKKSSTPDDLAKIFRIFVPVALFMYMSLVLFAKDALRLLVTERYFSGAELVVFLAPAILMSNMYIFAPGIAIAKKTNLTIWINVGGAILNVALNYWLIPVFEIIGAGVATFLASLFIFSANMIASQKFYAVPHRWSQIIIAFIFAFILCVFFSNLEFQGIVRWAMNCFSLIIFLFLCVHLKFFKASDLWHLVKL